MLNGDDKGVFRDGIAISSLSDWLKIVPWNKSREGKQRRKMS